VFRDRRHAGIAVALGLIVLLALLDFILPSGDWYADHPMTSAAIATIVGFIAAGVFLEEWMRDREARRLSRISTVAYRSLAQYANDAGRTLLAPVTGADLYALGVPEATPAQLADDLAMLAKHGHQAGFAERTGSWSSPDQARLDTVLRDLLGDQIFVRRLFRRTAVMRRRLQEVTALWAPVMLTSARYAEDLGRLRELTDALELLQEELRRTGGIGVRATWAPDPAWARSTADQFWRTIEVYERIRDGFGDLADLPSDAIINRRGVSG
jgi:hypothetical protein